jgi:hypothetical protein
MAKARKSRSDGTTPKVSKNPKTGRFEKAKEDNSGGVPFGWTPIEDMPSETKAPKLPTVIKVEHPVEKNGYVANAKAMAALGQKMIKAGMSVFQTSPMTQEEADKRLKPSKTKSDGSRVRSKAAKKKEIESD